MQEKLVIYLHANDLTKPSWAVVDADNAVRQSAHHDNAESLAQIAEDKELIVIVPAEDVLLTIAQLPKMNRLNRSRLAQAVPFAVEEQLIEDVDKLHFAVGDHQSDGSLPVAIVSQEKMREWISQLQLWNMKADALLPASLTLPLEENTWHVMLDEMAIVRMGESRGFGCDKNNLAELMDLALTSNEKRIEFIHIHNYTNDAFASALEVTVRAKEDFARTEQIVSDLARNVIKIPTINLLQGAYAARKSRLPQMGKVWKTISYLAIAWVFLLFFYPTISYLILKQRMSGIDAQIAQLYKRNFPQASSIIAPKLRMEEKLQKRTAQIGENRLLLMTGYIGKGMLKTSGIKLKRFDFQNNQLTLELTAATSEDFAVFTDFLIQQSLRVKQQNANLVGPRINATLQIEIYSPRLAAGP